MGDDQKVYMPSSPLGPGDRYGVLSGFDPGTRTLPAGFRAAPPFKPIPVAIVLEKDVAVTLRDGVTIHVDVLRPEGDQPVPVIVAWSPYGKGQGTSASVLGIFGLVGLGNAIVSGLEKFEGPDPAYWCAQGYAICNPDIRGVAQSEGDSVLWDRQEGRDCYDLIEWLAAQPWCTGKVAMSGTSYLAAAQWFTAAEQPPHLAAINPWEGVSDVYRDLVMRGGMPDTGFARQLRDHSFYGLGAKEDIVAEADARPLMDELWAGKIPDFDRITVPAYVVASYSNTLHTAGTFRAWRRMASAEKWLRIHNTQEWPDYYDEDNREELRRFFDHFLKGDDNGWENTPRVRYSLLDLAGGDRVGLAADEFPPAGAVPTRFYLDGNARTLTTTAPAAAATAGYAIGSNPDEVSFVTRFDHETVLVGYPKAHLFVEADGADDMDLFVLVQKLDAHGTPLQAFTTPNHGARMHDVTERGATILRYKGSDGRLRVSLRRLDETLTTDAVPAHLFDRVEKLAPGEVAEVEVDLLPLGLVFHSGEQLRFVVSGRNLLGPMMPGLREYTPCNEGRHVVHTGGEFASYVQIPVLFDLSSSFSPAEIDGFELRHARRVLALLKRRLGRQGLLDLLAGDIAEGNAFLRDKAALSNGNFKSGQTVIEVRGLTALRFAQWLQSAFDDEPVLLAAEPEHYVIATNPDSTVTVVENLGRHVCSVVLPAFGTAPSWAEEMAGELLPPAEYPFRRLADLRLPDGTVVGRVITQFGDTPAGFRAVLSCYFPSACGDEIVEHHREHLAVEFRNWIAAAQAAG